MLLYENAWPSNYDEIKTWYPVWYWEVFEMDAIWRVYGDQLDDIKAGIIQSADNNFIDYADAQTITKLENWLDIIHDGPRTLAERRSVIKAFIIGSGRIGKKEIKELIAVFTEGDANVELIGGMVLITVMRDYRDNRSLNDCYFILSSRIPAHLRLELVDNSLRTYTNTAHITTCAGTYTEIALRPVVVDRAETTTLYTTTTAFEYVEVGIPPTN